MAEDNGDDASSTSGVDSSDYGLWVWMHMSPTPLLPGAARNHIASQNDIRHGPMTDFQPEVLTQFTVVENPVGRNLARGEVAEYTSLMVALEQDRWARARCTLAP